MDFRKARTLRGWKPKHEPPPEEADLFATFSSVCINSNGHLWSKRCSLNREPSEGGIESRKALPFNLRAVQTMPRKARVSLHVPTQLPTATAWSTPPLGPEPEIFEPVAEPEQLEVRRHSMPSFAFPDYQNPTYVDKRHISRLFLPPTPPDIHGLPSPPTVLSPELSPHNEHFEPEEAPKVPKRWIPNPQASADAELFTFEKPLSPLLSRRSSVRMPPIVNCPSPPIRGGLRSDPPAAPLLGPAHSRCKAARRFSVKMRVRPINPTFGAPLLTTISEPAGLDSCWLRQVSPMAPAPPCLKHTKWPTKTSMTSTKATSRAAVTVAEQTVLVNARQY